MTPIEKDKLEILCKKWNLSELKISKGIFMADDNSGITMNLRGDVPMLGVTIAGTLQTEGHGILKVADIQIEMNQIMKSKTIPTSKSSVPEHSESAKTDEINSDKQKSLEKVPAGTLPDAKASKAETTEPKSKLGAGDTSPNKGTTTAICQNCKCTITGTIDTFRQIQDEYGVIYCLKCSEDADGKHDTKEEPAKASTKIPMCRKCGIEVSHARALACLGNDEPCMCEDCGEKHDETKHQEKEKGKEGPVKEREARPEEPKVNEIIMDEKLPTPTNKQEAKLPVKKTDAQIDEMIELAKAEKFLKGQGGSYTVSGKNRPDSAMVQKIANAENISSEILFAEQTKEYAHVVVRGHQGNNYIDAVVHHDFETEFQLQTMEIIKKNPQILDHYEGLIPVLKEGAFIVISDKQIDAKYHLIHTLLSFKTFSLRDATTKAMQIVQSKLLNQDPRTKEEVVSEQKDRDLVEERNQKR